MAFQRPNNPCGATNLSCGQSTLRQVILPGQMDSITFNGTAGEQADIRTAVRSGSYAPVLELFDASGNRTGTSSSGVLQPALTATGGLYAAGPRPRRRQPRKLSRQFAESDQGLSRKRSEPPSITLVQPTGGDVIAGGSPFRIQWQSDDNTSLRKANHIAPPPRVRQTPGGGCSWSGNAVDDRHHTPNGLRCSHHRDHAPCK